MLHLFFSLSFITLIVHLHRFLFYSFLNNKNWKNTNLFLLNMHIWANVFLFFYISYPFCKSTVVGLSSMDYCKSSLTWTISQKIRKQNRNKSGRQIHNAKSINKETIVLMKIVWLPFQHFFVTVRIFFFNPEWLVPT